MKNATPPLKLINERVTTAFDKKIRLVFNERQNLANPVY